MELLSASNALRTRQESRRLGGFSKQWQSGQTLTVFYPIFWHEGKPEIKVATVWGHSINPKELSLKRIFVPSNSVIIDGEPTTQDTLYQFSRLAPLFTKGAYEAEVQKLEEKRSSLGETAYKKKLQQIDKDFDVEDGIIKKQAVVGKLRLVVSTEVVTVLMDDQQKPKLDTVKLVTQDLSDSKINKLYQLMSDARYMPKEGAEFFEVSYTFGTKNDRKLDAQVDPVGTPDGYALADRFPGEWDNIFRTVSMLPESSETIRKRNSSYRPVEENQIMQAIATYSVMSSELLDNLHEDDDLDRLKNNANMLRALRIPIQNPDVLEAMEELEKQEMLVAQRTDVAAEGEASVEGGEVPPTVQQLIAKEDIVDGKSEEHDVVEIGSGSIID